MSSSLSKRWLCSVGIILLVLLLLSGFQDSISVASNWKEAPFSVCTGTTNQKTLAQTDEVAPSVLCDLRNLVHLPPANATSFKIDSIQCVESKNGSPMIEFDVLECPPAYHQSTFTLESITASTTRIMGRVGSRTKIRNGCGVYQARVAALSQVNLYWTSNHKWYSNRIFDIEVATNVKQVLQERNITQAELTTVLGKDRLAYLQRHFDFIGGFSFELDGSDVAANRKRDCSDIPLSEWAPVGLFRSSESSRQMGSAQCSVPNYTVERLNQDFRGMRIRLLWDSHGEATRTQWITRLCPTMANRSRDLFQKYYDDCPDPQHDWMITWRFYRAVFSDAHFNRDHDGISRKVRNGDPQACVKFLGLGQYNATIIGLPTWLFVYETNEGLDNFLTSIESLLSECRVLHPDLFAHHIFLIQTATASDSGMNRKASGGSDWRGIQNYRIAEFCDEAVRRLSPHIDGVIPVFDLSFAWLDGLDELGWTKDGTHLRPAAYKEIFNVLMAGVSSMIKSRKKEDATSFFREGNPRWWANLTLDA